jgi:hypothetical protein
MQSGQSRMYRAGGVREGTMVRKRSARIWITTLLATGALGLAARAQAADDTARFYGAWISNYAYNDQMVIVESIHDGSGYRNYVRLPFSVTPAGNGSFSAANGRWSAAAARRGHTAAGWRRHTEVTRDTRPAGPPKLSVRTARVSGPCA